MKILTIISKEYKQIVKKKSFIISTLLTPFITALFFVIPLLFQQLSRESKTIEIIDYSGFVGGQFLDISGQNQDKDLLLNFLISTTNQSEQKGLLSSYESEVKNNGNFTLTPALKKKILEKKIDGILIIPTDILKTRKTYFFALSVSDFKTNRYISSTVQQILSNKILTQNNVPIHIVKEAIKNVDHNLFVVKKDSTSKSSSRIGYMLSLFMLTTLFAVIISYGQLIMRGVIEEKNSRIAEVIISSITPKTLFYGKIFGIGLAGLTQMAIWIILGAGTLAFPTMAAIDMSGVPHIPSIMNFFTIELMIYFVIFFIIGYFMYSILFSIVGASVNTDEEAQQFAAPVFYMLIIPFIIGILVTQNPDSAVATWTSLFPLFSPTLMFMRICVAPTSIIQIIASIILSIGTTFFLAWFGAKIFRTGILMYGKKPSVKEIIKWIRYR